MGARPAIVMAAVVMIAGERTRKPGGSIGAGVGKESVQFKRDHTHRRGGSSPAPTLPHSHHIFPIRGQVFLNRARPKLRIVVDFPVPCLPAEILGYGSWA